MNSNATPKKMGSHRLPPPLFTWEEFEPMRSYLSRFEKSGVITSGGDGHTAWLCDHQHLLEMGTW